VTGGSAAAKRRRAVTYASCGGETETRGDSRECGEKPETRGDLRECGGGTEARGDLRECGEVVASHAAGDAR
jgi:hypothetical protein